MKKLSNIETFQFFVKLIDQLNRGVISQFDIVNVVFKMRYKSKYVENKLDELYSDGFSTIPTPPFMQPGDIKKAIRIVINDAMAQSDADESKTLIESQIMLVGYDALTDQITPDVAANRLMQLANDDTYGPRIKYYFDNSDNYSSGRALSYKAVRHGVKLERRRYYHLVDNIPVLLDKNGFVTIVNNILIDLLDNNVIYNRIHSLANKPFKLALLKDDLAEILTNDDVKNIDSDGLSDGYIKQAAYTIEGFYLRCLRLDYAHADWYNHDVTNLKAVMDADNIKKHHLKSIKKALNHLYRLDFELNERKIS